MSVCPVPGMPRGALPAHYSKQPRSRQASSRLLAALPTTVGRKQAAPANTLPARRGVKAMQKYKKLSGLRNNFPPAVIIFTKRLFAQSQMSIVFQNTVPGRCVTY